MFYEHNGKNMNDRRMAERLSAAIAAQQAMIDYVAMMADIELPTDTETQTMDETTVEEANE